MNPVTAVGVPDTDIRMETAGSKSFQLDILLERDVL